MEDLGKVLKTLAKKAIKAVAVPIAIGIGCVALVFVILAASVYFITIDDGTYKEDDWSSMPFGAGEFTDGLKVTADGQIASNYTTQQIWDKMQESGGRASLYLNGPKELAQMMYAEMVTQLPDLREDTSKIRTMEEWKETFDNLQEEEAKYQAFSESQEGEGGQFTKFDLSDEELRGIAGMCAAEQGSAIGAAAEASLMANKYDISGQTGSIASYVLNCGWWGSTEEYYSQSRLTDEILVAVKQVLVEGKRTLPKYVDEHDMIGVPGRSNIASATNDGVPIDKFDRSQYIPNKTIIKNNMGSTYTFYCFPTENSDPFGYISEERRKEYGDDCYGPKNTSMEESGYKTNLQGGIIRLARNLVTGESEVSEAELKKMETDYDNYKDDYEFKEKEKEKKKKKEEEEKKKEEDKEEKEDKEDKENDEEEQEEEEKVEPLLEFEEWMKQKGYTKNGNKWKRKGSKIYMSYLSPEEFDKKVNAYKTAKNDKEREEARNEVVKYFTLEKGSASGEKGTPKVASLDGFIYIGDSLTDGLSRANLNEENKKIMQNVKYYAEVGKAANYWLDNFGQFPPAEEVKGVCVMLGTNAPDDVSHMQTLIQKLSDKYSGVKVYIEKLLPVGKTYHYSDAYSSISASEMIEKINKYNIEIQEYCNQFDNVFFIDTTDGYVGDDGFLLDEVVYQSDGLHLKETHYDRLVENLASQICQGSSDDIPQLSSMDGVLFVGDSITNGIKTSIMPSSPELQEKLKNCEHRAYPGEDIDFAIQHIDKRAILKSPHPPVEKFPSDSEVKAVCVMMGTNQPEGQESMKTFIEKMLEKYPGKPIYVQKTFPRAKGSTGFAYTPEEHNELLKKYNKDIEEYCSSKENVYFIDATDGYVQSDGYLDRSKVPQDGVHLYGENGIQWVENIIEQITGDEGETSSDGSSLKMNKKALTSDPDFSNNEAWKDSESPYNTPSLWGQCTWFAWGKFYEIYGFSPGFSGNGVDCVDQLIEVHPDKFEKSDTPVAGSVFSFNNHVGIVLDVDGDNITIQDGNYNGQSDPWEVAITDWQTNTYTLSWYRGQHSDIVFANPKGATVSNEDSTSKSKSNSTYNIKIATFKEVTTSGDDGSNTVYSITTENINYYDMVKQYTMPFDYLWQLLVISEDRGFVFELLRTIYESDIEITVNDNLEDTTVTTVDVYTVEEKLTEKGTVSVKYKQKVKKGGEEETIQKQQSIPESVATTFTEGPYTNTKVVRTVTNTVKVDLTRANVWIVDYTKNYTYKEDKSSSSNTQPIGPIRSVNSLQPGDEQYLIDEAVSKVSGEIVSASVEGLSGQRDYCKEGTTTTNTETYKQEYEEGEKSMREKTQKILINPKSKTKERIKVVVKDIDVFTDVEDVPEEDQLTEEDIEEIEGGKTDDLEEDDTDSNEDNNQDDESNSEKEDDEDDEKDDDEDDEKEDDEDDEDDEKDDDEDDEDDENDEDDEEDDDENKEPEETPPNKLSTEFVDINTFRYKEKNFVTLLTSYQKARANILNAGSWLFQLIEENESTVEMLDLTKYLLYRVTGNELYGVTEFDFSIYEPSEDFNDADNGIMGATTEEKVWYALRKAGYSEEAAAGVLGNFAHESGVRSEAVQGDYAQPNQEEYCKDYANKVDSGVISKAEFVHSGPGGGGYGLAQWTYYTLKEQLYDYAKSTGASIADAEMQMGYLVQALKKGVGANGTGYTQAQWENAKTPEEAAIAWEWFYENHLGPTDVRRQTSAREYYEKFKGRPLSSFEGGSGSGSYKVKKDSSGNIIELVWDGSPEYIQWDPNSEWANKVFGGHTVANTGCNPTSTAIALETLLGKKVNPLDVCSYAHSTGHYNGAYCGYGADNIATQLCAEKWGVNYKYLATKNTKEVEKVLKEGKIIVAAENCSPWYGGGGHSICIMGYKDGKTFIRDPNNPEGSGVGSTWYDLNEVVKYNMYWSCLWK